MSEIELSHWDFREKFSCIQIAGLILGFDPIHEPEVDNHGFLVCEEDIRVSEKIKLVYGSIVKSYARGVDELTQIYLSRDIRMVDSFDVDGCIYSDNLENIFPGFLVRDLVIDKNVFIANREFEENSKSILRKIGVLEVISGFESTALFYQHCKVAIFDRREVVRWLKSKNLNSVYKFDLTTNSLLTARSVVAAPRDAVWPIIKPKKIQGYAMALLRALDYFQEVSPQKPPTGRMVLEYWRETLKVHPEIEKCLPDEVSYYDSDGNTKHVGLKSLGKTILRYTGEIEEG